MRSDLTPLRGPGSVRSGDFRERTRAGLEAARARGKVGGRPRKMTEKKIAMAQSLYDDPEHSIKDICETLGVSRATLYRYVRVKND